jgi:hypothetical protein
MLLFGVQVTVNAVSDKQIFVADEKKYSDLDIVPAAYKVTVGLNDYLQTADGLYVQKDNGKYKKIINKGTGLEVSEEVCQSLSLIPFDEDCYTGNVYGVEIPVYFDLAAKKIKARGFDSLEPSHVLARAGAFFDWRNSKKDIAQSTQDLKICYQAFIAGNPNSLGAYCLQDDEFYKVAAISNEGVKLEKVAEGSLLFFDIKEFYYYKAPSALAETVPQVFIQLVTEKKDGYFVPEFISCFDKKTVLLGDVFVRKLSGAATSSSGLSSLSFSPYLIDLQCDQHEGIFLGTDGRCYYKDLPQLRPLDSDAKGGSVVPVSLYCLKTDGSSFEPVLHKESVLGYHSFFRPEPENLWLNKRFSLVDGRIVEVEVPVIGAAGKTPHLLGATKPLCGKEKLSVNVSSDLYRPRLEKTNGNLCFKKLNTDYGLKPFTFWPGLEDTDLVAELMQYVVFGKNKDCVIFYVKKKEVSSLDEKYQVAGVVKKNGSLSIRSDLIGAAINLKLLSAQEKECLLRKNDLQEVSWPMQEEISYQLPPLTPSVKPNSISAGSAFPEVIQNTSTKNEQGSFDGKKIGGFFLSVAALAGLGMMIKKMVDSSVVAKQIKALEDDNSIKAKAQRELLCKRKSALNKEIALYFASGGSAAVVAVVLLAKAGLFLADTK